MKRVTLELNKVWGRALCAALMILPLGLSGCFPSAGNFGLAVSVSGSGQVSSSPAGIDCGSDCAETLAAGSIITLNAIPASGAMFTGWGGDCSGNTPTCTLTMSASRAVTASFTFTTDPPPPAAQYTLSVNVTGTGSVSSTPAGISCGTDCTESYTDGTSVTLTATPGTGFQFSSWSGACSGTGSCVVAMSAARSVSASFTPVLRALSVTLNGTGSVTSAPAGINCGTDCSENYAHGSNVTLTATPGANQQFSGWLGACSGTTTTCTVSMTEARSVTATFTESAPPPAPSVSLSADPTSVVSGGSSTLRWSSNNVTSCEAAGGWSGSKSTSGTEPTGSITAPTTYTLRCTGPNGDATNSLTVYIEGQGTILYQQGFENYNDYSSGVHVTYDARAEHSTGWNDNGAVKMFLGTPPDPSWQQYSGWQYYEMPQSLYQSDRIHVRWCAQFGPSILQSALDGGKLLIMHRNTPDRVPNPRVIAHLHNYSTSGRQLYSANNIDNDPPNPPLFTLDDKTGEWLCFEIGVSQANNTRQFWATVQGGSEVLLQTEPLNRTDGMWTGGVEFGFWGPVANVGPDSWWKLDELVISNAKIGPPPGFAAP